jgi:hypothetical protein
MLAFRLASSELLEKENMADAKLSPRQLADLLDRLDEVKQSVEAMRQHLILAMAERRRPAAKRASRPKRAR